MMIRVLITIIIAFLAGPVLSDTQNKKWLSDWEESEAYENVQIECRQHISKINECRYTTYSDLSPDALLAVNIDGPNLKNWMANMLHTEQFDIKSPFNYKVYTTYNFPGARNRDSVTHSIVTFDEAKKSVRLQFKSVKHPDKPKDLRYVRFPAITGFWEFTELPSGQTKIVYQNIGLPGEYVQKVLYALYNYSTKEAGAKTVVNLLSEAKKPEYMSMKFDYSLAQN